MRMRCLLRCCQVVWQKENRFEALDEMIVAILCDAMLSSGLAVNLARVYPGQEHAPT